MQTNVPSLDARPPTFRLSIVRRMFLAAGQQRVTIVRWKRTTVARRWTLMAAHSSLTTTCRISAAPSALKAYAGALCRISPPDLTG
jgi:hypothetical protein